jgi:hypothetical protein
VEACGWYSRSITKATWIWVGLSQRTKRCHTLKVIWSHIILLQRT